MGFQEITEDWSNDGYHQHTTHFKTLSNGRNLPTSRFWSLWTRMSKNPSFPNELYRNYHLPEWNPRIPSSRTRVVDEFWCVSWRVLNEIWEKMKKMEEGVEREGITFDEWGRECVALSPLIHHTHTYIKNYTLSPSSGLCHALRSQITHITN